MPLHCLNVFIIIPFENEYFLVIFRDGGVIEYHWQYVRWGRRNNMDKLPGTGRIGIGCPKTEDQMKVACRKLLPPRLELYI